MRVWGTPNSWTAHFMENTTRGRVLGAGRGLPSAEDNPLDLLVLDVDRQSKRRYTIEYSKVTALAQRIHKKL